jgi:hypothetical protein
LGLGYPFSSYPDVMTRYGIFQHNATTVNFSQIKSQESQQCVLNPVMTVSGWSIISTNIRHGIESRDVQHLGRRDEAQMYLRYRLPSFNFQYLNF